MQIIVADKEEEFKTATERMARFPKRNRLDDKDSKRNRDNDKDCSRGTKKE
jgi:hypothetical protein